MAFLRFSPHCTWIYVLGCRVLGKPVLAQTKFVASSFVSLDRI